jgi:hypothetical protein
MPGSVTQPASLIDRLPAHLRTPALRKLSANANQPGGAKGAKAYGSGALGRAASAFISEAAKRGIVIIESRPSALAADIATVPGPNTTAITITYGTGATPGSAAHTGNIGQPVTYVGSGAKDISVTVPANYRGEAQIVV